MPFPQGGDFPRVVDNVFKVFKSDRRICINDIGPTAAITFGFPSFVSAGAVQAAAGGTNLTIPWPSGHQVGDVALLWVQNYNQTAFNFLDAKGFVNIITVAAGSPTGVDPTHQSGVFWCRATSTTMDSPILENLLVSASSYSIAIITTYRNCIATGNPYNTYNAATDTINNTTVDIPGLTTTVDDCRIVFGILGARDSATSGFNNNLASATVSGIGNYVNVATSAGNGGNINVADGLKSTAGTIGTTTGTYANGQSHGDFIIALKPPTPIPANICAAGHRLKFPGTCLTQGIGTFNSTDPAFQPDYPACLIDYDGSGVSDGTVLQVAFREGTGVVNSKTDGASGANVVATISGGAVRDYSLYSLANTPEGSYTLALVDMFNEMSFIMPELDTNPVMTARIVQLGPGLLPHIPGSTSDLYQYDVVGEFKPYKRLAIQFIESIGAIIKQEGVPGSFQNLVTTDYYTTVSGQGDICVGDSLPPYIVYISPPASGTNLRPRNQTVDFVLGDLISGVNLSSLRVGLSSQTTGNITLVSGGADQTGGRVAITGTPSSYHVIYTPNFQWNLNDDVVVTISGSDLPPFYCSNGVNFFKGDIKFKILNQADMGATITPDGDLGPPYISFASPVPGSIDNEVFAPVIITIADDLTGVKLSTVNISIDGVSVVLNGVAQTDEVYISGSAAAYTITYTKDTSFAYGSVIEVLVYAEDKVVSAPNVLNTSYSFTLISNDSLRIENFLPPIGTSVNPEDIDIQVDIIDDTYGVSEDLSFIVVNGTIVDATVTPITSGIRFTYHPPNDFAFEEPIRVKVHGQSDALPHVIVKEHLYILFYGYRFLIPNQHPFERNVPIDVFVRATNISELTKDLATGYYFTTYTQPASNFGASITPITPWSDLPGTITGVGPEHRYGETVTVTFYAKDYEGHELGPVTFNYTIENSPE